MSVVGEIGIMTSYRIWLIIIRFPRSPIFPIRCSRCRRCHIISRTLLLCMLMILRGSSMVIMHPVHRTVRRIPGTIHGMQNKVIGSTTMVQGPVIGGNFRIFLEILQNFCEFSPFFHNMQFNKPKKMLMLDCHWRHCCWCQDDVTMLRTNVNLCCHAYWCCRCIAMRSPSWIWAGPWCWSWSRSATEPIRDSPRRQTAQQLLVLPLRHTRTNVFYAGSGRRWWQDPPQRRKWGPDDLAASIEPLGGPINLKAGFLTAPNGNVVVELCDMLVAIGNLAATSQPLKGARKLH